MAELKHYEDYIDLKLTQEVKDKVPYLKEYPFIGKDFSESEEKVLILGMSIYNHETDIDGREKVSDNYAAGLGHIHGVLYRGFRLNDWDGFALNGNKIKFNREIEKTFFRISDIYTEEFEVKRSKFWKSIVHYQLIQEMMDSSTHQDNKTSRDLASKAVLDIVELLGVDHVIMFSNNKVYQNSIVRALGLRIKDVTQLDGSGSNGGSAIRSVQLKRNEKDFRFTSLLHPSARGKSRPCFELQNDLLQKTMSKFLKSIAE